MMSGGRIDLLECGYRVTLRFRLGVSFIRLVIQMALHIRKAAL